MTLRKHILRILLGLLLGTLALIAGVGYFTTRDSIRDLRSTIMASTEKLVAAELRHYFGRSPPALEFMRGEISNDPAAALADWRRTGLAMAKYMRTAEELSFIYYADASSGDLVGVQRDTDGSLLLHHTVEANGRVPQNYRVDTADVLEPFRSETVTTEPYDPRERPWFKAAVEAQGMVWTAPYEFQGGGVSGISATLAERDELGEVTGVFAVDMLLADVAQLLDSLRVGEAGGVFIVREDGEFLVDGKARAQPGIAKLRAAVASLDLPPMMRGKLAEFQFSHAGEDYFALLDPIELPGANRVGVAVVVPASEFMGVVRRNGWMALGGALGIIAIAVAASVFISHRVTRRLATISEEMEQIAELRFSDSGPQPPPSTIHEIARFSDSVGRMKVSLRSFSRYVPRDIVRKLLAQRHEAQLGGELREVTVQFSDLVGFTGMSERLESDAMFRELRIFLEALAEAQAAHGGITSNFTGDGTMALFNAPDDQPAHAAAACAAALDITEALRALNSDRSAHGRPELRARIGINTAEVLVGNLGTSDRFTYTAVGDGVNIASRLEGLNKWYGTEILVGEACREHAGDAFEWRRVDQIAVMGRSTGIALLEPLGRAGEVPEELLQFRDRYEEAFAAYCEGDFERALAIFAELREGGVARCLSASVLYDRVGELMHAPLPEDWDGTIAAPFK